MSSDKPHIYDHFIEARPQISILPNKEDGSLSIATTTMDLDKETVRREGVTIPGECIEEVARAMLKAIGK